MHSAIMFHQLLAHPLTQSSQHIKLTITGFLYLVTQTHILQVQQRKCLCCFIQYSKHFGYGPVMFNTSLSLQYRDLDLQFSELDIIIIWIEKTIDNLYVNDLTQLSVCFSIFAHYQWPHCICKETRCQSPCISAPFLPGTAVLFQGLGLFIPHFILFLLNLHSKISIPPHYFFPYFF